MSDLVAPETLTCKCHGCLCYPDSNLNIALGDGCIFWCGFIGFTTVTLFAGEGSGFSFTRSLLQGWSYHPDHRCGREHELLIIKVEVLCGLWLRSGISCLLSFIKVYLSFLLYSKLDKFVIGRPLVYSLAFNQIGHSSSQLRVHASKEMVNQRSSPLLWGTS